MRIEQYFLMTDYSLWEVILNGNSPTPTRIVNGVVQFITPTTAEQRHQLEILKKSAIRVENSHFDLEEQSLDDFFNNLKIYKAEVKGSSTSSQNTQNVAFVSSKNTDNTNDQSSSPQLDNEDLKQIDADDLEEVNLKWQMTVLTMRARRFLQKARRNIGANGTAAIGFDMSKVECYNCHRRGHFARECRSPRDNMNKDTPRRTVQWRFLLQMLWCLSHMPPQAHPVLQDLIMRDNALVELKKKFKKERDDLKITLEKFQTSSKNLSKLLESQVSDKTGLGYNSEVFNSQVFDCENSDNSVPKIQENDKYKSGEGYHAVHIPYTRTFMLLKPDLVFNDASTANPSQSWLRSQKTLSILYDVQGNPQQALKDKGYVAIGGNPKGGKITGKGKIKTGKLDFDDVYFVKDLKFNLFSVSHLYDKKNNVLFTDTECVVLSFDYKLPDENHVLLRVPRENTMYNVDLKNVVLSVDLTCLFAKATLDESNLWHRRLRHINFKTMNKLVKDPLGKFDGKADEGFLVGYSVNSKAFRVFNIKTRIVQETLHINFLKNKPNVAGIGPKWLFDIDTFTKSMNYQPVVAGNLPNDNEGIKENLDASKVGKKTVSAQQYVLLPLWSTSSQDPHNTDVDVAFDVKENATEVYVSPSGSDKTKKHDDKDKKYDKGKSHVDLSTGVRDLRAEFKNFLSTALTSAEADIYNLESNISVIPIPTTRVYKDHHVNQIISDLNSAPQTRSMARMVKKLGGLHQINDEDFHTCMFACFLSQEEPKKVHQALKDPSWIEVIQEELLQFKMQKVWVLIDLSKGKRAIGSKWVFRNKKDEREIVIRNKARLVAQGHNQEEGINYDEVFGSVARIEAIRLFLAYASFMGFMVYQMDVKSVFLYRTIKEEVYVCQPTGFKDLDYPDKVYKMVKALYGLHQAHRAWYETLANYLLENGFQRGKIDQTLFIKKQKGDILLVQVFVDDIIFGSTNKELYVKSASTRIETKKPLLKDPDGKDVDVHIYRSMIRSLMYLTSSRLDIMFAVYACDRFQVTPKVSQLHAVKRIFSDYDGASLDRKSTTGGCRLISWQCKKQTVVATSSTEAEYIATASCCSQDLWIQNYEELTIPRKMTTEDVIRQDLRLDDVDRVECLPNAEIFVELALLRGLCGTSSVVQWRLLSSAFLQVENLTSLNDLTSHNTKYTSLALTQKVFTNIRRVGKGFLVVKTPLFVTMLVQPQEEEEDDEIPNAPSPPTEQDPIPIPHTIPLASPPQEQPTATSESTMSLLNTLMETCATLSQKVYDLEKDKHTQALEIIKLKKRVNKLEKKQKSKSLGLKRLRKGRIDQDVSVATKDVSATEPSVFDDEEVTMTMAQTLIKMKAKKAMLLDEQIA
nr:hypothetical protein [Tanacetum cinerariifolium]